MNESLLIERVFIPLSLGKKAMLETIEKSLKRAEEKRTTKFVIYYCGHGSDIKGSWVTYHEPGSATQIDEVKANLVEIKDILELVNKSDYEESVEMTSESCFSGFLCHEAKDWIEDHKDRDFKELSIISTAYRNNRGIWGKYRKYK